MTLHWWMHWFWVTAQLTVILASPLPSTTEDPRIREFHNRQNFTLNLELEQPTTIDSQIIEGVKAGTSEKPEISTRTSFRVAKAIGSYDPLSKSNVASANNNPLSIETSSPGSFEERNRNVNNAARNRASSGNMIKRRDGGETNETRDFTTGSTRRDSRITWVLTTSRSPVRRKTEEITAEDIIRNFSSATIREEEKDLTVLPLRVEGTRFKLVVNRTRTITAEGVDGFSTRTFNGSEDIEIDQELAEPRLAATAASILQAGISESTRLSRARNTFSSDFQRDREEDRSSEIDVSDSIVAESDTTEIESSAPSVVDIAAITGSCLATVVLISTMASLGFIMYRRKYLNPPQTLNSDKCSNPDSSGYIDDSTIRDNSEEMYSLDNDSFLNSLEAMTIQNYWTDSVKHTKL